MDMIISKGVVVFDGRFLLLKTHKELWEFAGGEMIDGETPEQTLARELKEETGLRGDIIIDLPPNESVIDGVNTFAYVFLMEADDNTVNLSKEHTDFGWFTMEEAKLLEGLFLKSVLIEYLEKASKLI